MKILAVDTSTKATSLALYDGGRKRSGYFHHHTHPPSDRVFPILEEMLRGENLNIADIDVFGTCIGPGSFTGLRIGLGLVKTCAWVLRRPVLGVDAVRVAAERARRLGLVDEFETFVAVVHGFNTTMFHAEYRIVHGEVQDVSPLAWFDGADGLEQFRGRRLLLPADAPFTCDFAERIDDVASPSADIIAEITRLAVERGDVPAFDSVQPLYLKPISIGGVKPRMMDKP